MYIGSVFCLCTMCITSAHGGQKRVPDLMGVVLQMIVGRHVALGK